MEARIHGANDMITVEFDSPMPQFAALLASSRFGVATADSHGVVVGSGPYAIQSVTASRMTLVANPDYWGGRRFPETISLSCNVSPHAQLLELSAKRADLIEIPIEGLRHAQQQRIRLSQTLPTELIVLSAERARNTEMKLRQALSESIDRPALLNFIFQKQGEIAVGLLPNWITGYSALRPAIRDTAHARQLRDEAGGRPAYTVGYNPGDAELQLVAERVALNAREAGLSVQVLARTSEVDWILRRVKVETAHPAVALTEALRMLHLRLEPNDALSDTRLESVFRAERAALADYTAIPLVHAKQTWAASERLRDWSNASPLAPLPSESWVES
jgi:ABC-type transport system substrate-binding protein